MKLKEYTLRIIYDEDSDTIVEICESRPEEGYSQIEVDGEVKDITKEFSESVEDLSNSNDLLGIA